MAGASSLFLGIEIGGTKLQLGLGRADGTILALERRIIRPDAGAQGILRQIREAYPTLLNNPVTRGEIPSAAGIGFGGPVDADRGVTSLSHQVSGWEQFGLAAWAVEALQIPRIAIANDADTAGLGEANHGAGVGLSPIFYVTIGSGIGGGLILDGQIYRGSGRGAAEIGHLWIDDAELGPQKLEAIASGWAIGRAARAILAIGNQEGPLMALVQGNLEKVDASTVARAAADGDSQSLEILCRASRAVGQALAQVVTLLNPRRIILGGGVSLMDASLWLEPIRQTVRTRAFPPFLGASDIVLASLGEEVVIHGALALARQAAWNVTATSIPESDLNA